jgi:hypothetical protein
MATRKASIVKQSSGIGFCAHAGRDALIITGIILASVALRATTGASAAEIIRQPGSPVRVEQCIYSVQRHVLRRGRIEYRVLAKIVFRNLTLQGARANISILGLNGMGDVIAATTVVMPDEVNRNTAPLRRRSFS